MVGRGGPLFLGRRWTAPLSGSCSTTPDAAFTTRTKGARPRQRVFEAWGGRITWCPIPRPASGTAHSVHCEHHSARSRNLRPTLPRTYPQAWRPPEPAKTHDAARPPPPLRCNLGVYPLARRTGTQAHRSLFSYRRTAVVSTLLEP